VDGSVVTVRSATFASQAEQVGFMRDMVTEYRSTYTIHALSRDIALRQSGCPAKDKRCHAIRLGEWVQREITYVNEGTETFQTPLHTLKCTWGDCDEFATLTASMVESIGVPCELVAMGWNPPANGHGLPFGREIAGAWAKVFAGKQLRHIFCRAVLLKPGRPPLRLPLDATLDRPVGALTDPLALALNQGLQVHTVIL